MRTVARQIERALRAQDREVLLNELLGADGDPGKRVTIVDTQDGRIKIVWRDGAGVFSLPVDLERPTACAINRLALAVPGGAVREAGGGDPYKECFDARSLAQEFLSGFRQVHDRFFVGVEAELAATQVRFLARVLLLRFLQTKGWFVYKGRKDYLQALYADWKKSPGPHRFYQRLAVVFFNALNEPRQEARWLARALVGEVPHLGGGMFAPELYEREMQTQKGYATVPDDLFEALIGDEGLLTHYEFSLEESAPNESVVAVTPEVMGAVFEAFLAGEDVPMYPDTASLRLACREVVARHMGGKVPLEVPTQAAAVKGFIEKLDCLHIFDGACRCGSYLVAALEEVTGLYCQVSGGGSGPEARAKVKRQVLTESIRGLDTDDLAVQVARFRLALCVAMDDPIPTPLPDLRSAVKKGGAIDGQSLKWRLPPEGQHTEYKASFEWDSRRMMRSAALRFGTLKTICAFLNAEGGALYIGVNDSGAPVGIGPDLELIEDGFKHDAFVNRFREILKNHIDPIPLNKVTVTIEDAMGLEVVVVKVLPQSGVTYLVSKDQSGRTTEDVFVRDGNRTVELQGRARDQFVVKRSRDA